MQNIESTDLFSSTATGETYKIKHYFKCDSKCLVYLTTCRTCKLQYTGKTCDAFRKRWNSYWCYNRKAERGEECKQKYLHEHFLQDDHHGFLNDAQVTLIDKTQASDTTKREYFWMRTLKHTSNMVWILRRHISGWYYVGLLHDFVRFIEALGFIT